MREIKIGKLKIPLNFYFFLVLLCLAGLADSTYLSVKHYTYSSVACSLSGGGCNAVLDSGYSSFGPVPVALLGVMFYSAVTFLLVLSSTKKKKIILKTLVGLICGGFAMSAYFVFLQLFVIKSICVYCMVSASISLALFVSSVAYLVKNHRYYE